VKLPQNQKKLSTQTEIGIAREQGRKRKVGPSIVQNSSETKKKNNLKQYFFSKLELILLFKKKIS